MFFNADGEEVGHQQSDNNDGGNDPQARIKQLKAQALNKRKKKLGSSNMLRAQTDAPSWGAAGRMPSSSRLNKLGNTSDVKPPPKPSSAPTEKQQQQQQNDAPPPYEQATKDGMIMSDFTDADLHAEHTKQEAKGYGHGFGNGGSNSGRNSGHDHNGAHGAFTEPEKGQGGQGGRGSRNRGGGGGGSGSGSGGGGGGGYEIETNLDFSDMNRFLTSPVPRRNVHQVVQAQIVRVKNGLRNKMYPAYEMYLKHNDKFLLAAKKRSKNKTSNYMISQDKHGKKESSGYCGKVRANFVGTEFTIFDDGMNPGKMKDDQKKETEDAVRQELGCVLYEQNILGSKGPREMTVVLPKVETSGKNDTWRPMTEKDGILNQWKGGNTTSLVSMKNKKPQWNDKVNAFVLNFNGRVTHASVKNFQLASTVEGEENKCVLQFGRVGKDEFNVDFAWPLSPLQAFAICLTSFDYKFACE